MTDAKHLHAGPVMKNPEARPALPNILPASA
jgi:hypothetical protein